MGKENVLAILDEVSRTYRGEYTELMIPLMKNMVEEIYEAAEECRVDDVLSRMVTYGSLWELFLFELPKRGFEVAGPKGMDIADMFSSTRQKMAEDIARIFEKRCGLRGV
jgi:hypothetical protein